MKPAAALLILSFGVSAQPITRSFGSVVFPGGTSATTPGTVRTFGSVVFPGGSPATPPVRTAPPVVVAAPGHGFVRPVAPVSGQNFRRNGNGGNRNGRNNTIVYAYPVYVGNYYDPGVAGPESAVAPPPVQPPAMGMYPAEAARPVMIQVAPRPEATAAPETVMRYEQPTPEPAREPEHYLLAFKDHTVYSAVAYWFDGDTLHYFTTGSTHNQASVSLLDRDLTQRLNKELGIDFRMPDAK
jgi:hypothetical protein